MFYVVTQMLVNCLHHRLKSICYEQFTACLLLPCSTAQAYPLEEQENFKKYFIKTIQYNKVSYHRRSHGSIHGQLCKKNFLTSSSITIQNLVAVSCTVHALVGGPEHFGRLGPAYLGRVEGDMLLPTWDTMPNYVFQVKRYICNYGDLPENCDQSLTSQCQWSQSFKVIQGHWN